ncbi:hypothetical protein QFZ56_008084 [Streptomyces achromogenes]|uniref:Uncharacterized protein n=1 Tax=Streptomyces achromogenes TaxID=67255 RepID=A0ABU0QH20_STRAH|nr:hypothetical protein [Streptomyces achromogenes]MDQ0689038.1 hypothetical protein [Streptomyces achromogenes]
MEQTAPPPSRDTSSLEKTLRHLLRDSLTTAASDSAVEEMAAVGLPSLRLEIEDAVRRAEAEEHAVSRAKAEKLVAGYGEALAEAETQRREVAEPAHDEAQRLCDH